MPLANCNTQTIHICFRDGVHYDALDVRHGTDGKLVNDSTFDGHTDITTGRVSQIYATLNHALNNNMMRGGASEGEEGLTDSDEMPVGAAQASKSAIESVNSSERDINVQGASGSGSSAARALQEKSLPPTPAQVKSRSKAALRTVSADGRLEDAGKAP